jgi:hypothetical protein
VISEDRRGHHVRSRHWGLPIDDPKARTVIRRACRGHVDPPRTSDRWLRLERGDLSATYADLQADRQYRPIPQACDWPTASVIRR